MTRVWEVTTTAVLADDEPLARQRIREYLAEATWVRCVGEAATGPEAVALVNRERPDLLFLDVKMPGLDGLQVLERLTHQPVVVFTTAYDSYAVAAFERRALDYLLKPFGRARFMAALAHAGETLAVQRAAAAPGGERAPLRQMFVRAPGRLVRIAVADVRRFEACDDYVTLHLKDVRILASIRMRELEAQLDPDQFLRIHRSHIVNVDAITAITPGRDGRLRVELRDGTKLIASRGRSRRVRRLAV